LVSFAKGDQDELMYLRYRCEDPTCDWCIVEFGPDECKDFANIVDNLLTDENRCDNFHDTPDPSRTHDKRSSRVQPTMQTDFFRRSDLE